MLGTDKEPGIYVRTLNDLFRAIEETSDDMLYSVSMSYLEVRISSRLYSHHKLSVKTTMTHLLIPLKSVINLIAHSEFKDFF